MTVTFRRWRRRQVVAGHRYRTGHRVVGRQMIEVDRVDVIDPAGITDADARRSGYRDAATTESLEIGYRLSPRGEAYLLGDSGRESGDRGPARDAPSR